MATEDIIREPAPPPPDSPQKMDLSGVQVKIEEALKSGNFSELARLNALAREISSRLTQEARSDERFNRGDEADSEYRNSILRNLGAAQRMVMLTQRASEVNEAPDPEPPGPSIPAEVAGVAGALGAADVAGRVASSGAVGRSQAAATAAKTGLQKVAQVAGDRAVAANFGRVTAEKGSKVASAAALEAAKRAGAANLASSAATVAPPGGGFMGREAGRVIAKTGAEKAKAAATKAATGAASTAAKKTAEVTMKQATKTAAEAATRRATARAFAATAARAAPRIFGAMPLALAEVAIGPLVASYKSTKQMETFFGRLEKLSQMNEGPLGVGDLDSEALAALSASPVLLDSMLKSGVIDNSAYAYANPEKAAEMGLSVGDGGVQRGGDIFTVGDVEGARAAEPGEDFGRRDSQEISDAGAFNRVGAELQAKIDAAPKKGEPGYIGRVGEDLPDESTPTTRRGKSTQTIEEDDSTPVARKKAVLNALGNKAEGTLPNIAEPKREARPDLTEATAARSNLGSRKPAEFDDMPGMPPGQMYSSDGLYPEPSQRDPAYATPNLAAPKDRNLGEGLKKLLETFSTMDIGKTMPDDIGV